MKFCAEYMIWKPQDVCISSSWCDSCQQITLSGECHVLKAVEYRTQSSVGLSERSVFWSIYINNYVTVQLCGCLSL